jgi:outer membrane lipoprotein SlyB
VASQALLLRGDYRSITIFNRVKRCTVIPISFIRQSVFVLVCGTALAPSAFAQNNRDATPFTPPPPRATAPASTATPYPVELAEQPAQVAQASAQQRYGTVESITALRAERDPTEGNGIAAGAILGGVFGRGVSSTGSTAGRNAATIVGAIAGGLIGNQVEKNVRGQPKVAAYRMNIRFDDGALRSVEQTSAIAVGSRVLMDRGVLRVVQAAETYQPYSQAQSTQPRAQRQPEAQVNGIPARMLGREA